MPRFRQLECRILMSLIWVIMLEVGSTQQCGNPGAARILLAMSTQKNASNHWLTKIAASSDVARLSRPKMNVEAGQHVGFPDAGWVKLEAEISTWSAPPGYEHFPGLGFYRFHNKPVSWDDARVTCETEGGHLMVINSVQEASVVRDFFDRKPVIEAGISPEWYHAGFHDKHNEGDYVTVLGGPLATSGYNIWTPDGSWIRGKTSNCGAIHTKLTYATGYCHDRRAYICEG